MNCTYIIMSQYFIIQILGYYYNRYLVIATFLAHSIDDFLSFFSIYSSFYLQ